MHFKYVHSNQFPYLRKTVQCMHLPKLKSSASHEAKENSYQFTGKFRTKSAWSELIAMETNFDNAGL